MANLELRRTLNFLGFVSTMLIAGALVISLIVSLFQESKGIPIFQITDVVSALTFFASLIAYLITIVAGFSYVRSKRNISFTIAQIIGTVIIIIAIIVGAIIK